MADQPFREAAQRAYRRLNNDYIRMQVASDSARSHGWWRNLVEHGPWAGHSGRTAPPSPEAIPGIAKLFRVTEDQVREMIAADWYGVQPDVNVSPRALQLAQALDELDEADMALAEGLIRRLATF
ncbi:hypothetical protein [Micromonospora thermarum]|uniref:Uncharacterized protein n=1 Tax=Micromonospora thermarum TaxID=2720024 RepID=A0ABX0Z7A1_9ACTN|nr:hypothetical protein [Micromonospora thermarum]NJP33730.1 hypothetical protein [Micromonospora thermarum]